MPGQSSAPLCAEKWSISHACPQWAAGWRLVFGDPARQAYFGNPRQSGTSHAIFKTPWVGDPRINIQEHKGKAKTCQVRQVLLAIGKLEDMRNER